MSTPVTRDPAAGRVVDRTRRFVGVVVRRAVVDPVRDGRPRAHDWPPGWRSVVAVALGCCVLSALLAITSPLLRATLPLFTIEAQEAVLPRATVWPLLLSIIVLLALVQTAALHAPWWLRTLGTLISVGTLLLWGFFGLVQADGLARLSPVVPLGLIIVLLVLVVLRAPRRPAWWEFPAVLAVLGIGVAAGPLTSGLVATGQALGYDAVPLLVATSIQDSALLAVPVMIAAGLSVAELTVGLTVQAGTQAARVSGRRWAYLVLGAVAAVRLTQAVVQLLGWDPVADGPATVITTLAVAGLLAGVGLTVIRIAGRPAAGTAEQLPEQANRIGLPVGVALAGLGVVASVVIIVRALGVLVLSGVTGSVDLPGLTALSSGSRLVLGVVLVLLGFRRARRRDVRQGLVLGLTGVVLVGLSSRFLTGFRWPTTLDPDLLNLVGTLAVLVIGSRRGCATGSPRGARSSSPPRWCSRRCSRPATCSPTRSARRSGCPGSPWSSSACSGTC